jgi:uncharacterized protein YjeT (DUF2065 family)
MKYFLCVLGMVFVIEGLPYFTFPAQIKTYLLKLFEVSDTTLRILGAAAVTLGLLLVYFGTT